MDALGWKTPHEQQSMKGAFTTNWLSSIQMDPSAFPGCMWFALAGIKPVTRIKQLDMKTQDKQRHFLSLQEFVLSHSSEIDKLELPTSATILKTNCLLTKSTTHYNEQTSPLFRSNRRLPCLERSVHQYSIKWTAKCPLRRASVSCGAHRDRCQSVCHVRFSPFSSL